MPKKGKSSKSKKTSMTPSLGSSGRVQPPEAARRRTDRPPDPEATSRLPQNFDVEGERNHGSDGDEAQTPPADRSQQGPRDVDRTPSALSPDRRPAAGTTTTTGSGEEDSSQRHHHRRSSPQPPISPNRRLATGPRQPAVAAAAPPAAASTTTRTASSTIVK